MALKNLLTLSVNYINLFFIKILAEQSESVKTAFWIGDCFIFTTVLNRLSYYVGGEIVTVAHLDRPLYLVRF